MKIQGAGLLLWLVCVLQTHALEYANEKLGFKATLPDGLQDVSATVMKRDSLAILGKRSADGKTMERLVMLQDLGAPIGREMPPASVVPKNARVEKLPWKSYDVLLLVVSENEGGKPTLTLNAQVPLKPRAIQVSVYGPAAEEAQLRQELRAIVASVEGPTNWGDLTVEASQKRLEMFSHGAARLWILGCLLVIAGAASIKKLFGRKNSEESGGLVSPDRSEELTSEGTNPMGRLLVCALVIYAGLVGLIVYTDNGKTDMAGRMGYAMGSLLIPLAITGFWACKSSKNWGWFRCGFTLLAMMVLVTMIRVAPRVGKAGARENRPQPAAESPER